MFNAKPVAAAFALFLTVNAAFGQDGSIKTEVPRGLWETQPDSFGLVYHVRTRACGRALCGRVERVKDRKGLDTRSTSVSHLILDRLRPRPDGSFEGTLAAPGNGILLKTRLEVRGSAMVLRICEAAACRAEIWTRLR